MLKIRNANIEDLSQLITVERLCFSKEEAATREAFEQRIRLIPDSFFVAEENGAIVGLINGPVIESAFITDDLFENIKRNPSTGGHQSILGLAVHPRSRQRGIASKLLRHLEVDARLKNRESITLTCKANLIRYYERQGFRNNGISNSEHAGESWYNMTKPL